MTVKETAEYLRIPLPTVYYLVQRGQLPAIQIGGRWRIKKEALDRDVLREDGDTQPTVLVVDDYQESNGEQCDPLVGEVLTLLPDSSRIIVCSQVRPPGLVGRAATGVLRVIDADVAPNGFIGREVHHGR